MKTQIYNVFLKVLGCVLFLLFVWFRFIRQRLPAEIPFVLNILKLGALLITCFLLFWVLFKIIYRLLFRSRREETPLFIFSFIFKPLEVFDQSIKSYAKFAPYYLKIFLLLWGKMKLYDKHLVISDIILRLIILFIFLMDVFIFHKFFYFYKFIYLFIFVYLIKYLFYCLTAFQLDYMNQVDKEINIHIGNIMGPIIPIDSLIYCQTNAAIENTQPFNIRPMLKDAYSEELLKKLNLPRGTTIDLKTLYKRYLENINYIVHVNTIMRKTQMYKNKFKYIEIFSLILYLVGWSYILLVSFHTLPFDSLEFLKYLLPQEINPFT